MNEAQVRHDLIDPALRAAGWELLPAKVAVELEGFPTLDHALNYYSDIQHWLYAA